MTSMVRERDVFVGSQTRGPHNSAIELARFHELRRRLLDAFPDLDEQTLADTLEGATNLHEALAALIRSAQEDECLAKALKERVDGLRLRLNRIATRAAQKGQIACETMEIAGIRKLAQPDFTASLWAGLPSVDIVNDTAAATRLPDATAAQTRQAGHPHRLDRRRPCTRRSSVLAQTHPRDPERLRCSRKNSCAS